jgi:DNA polymerase I-like protein with 3'-5' exonuclease and polymerase domains
MLSDWDRNFYTYNCIDTASMVYNHNKFWNEISSNQNHQDTYKFTIDLLDPLMFIMKRGIKVDTQSVSNMSKQLADEDKKKMSELCEVMGREVPNTFPNSAKQCQAYFYGELGVQPYIRDGKISVDDKALARLARGTASRAPVRSAKIVQEIRAIRKLKSTYMDIEYDEDGRFRCGVKPRGTKFGRISTGKTIRGTGMNMQNLPMRFKKYLIPDTGYFFIELDKASAEWVVTAYLSKDANMIKVVEEGLDPHIHTAHLMFGVDKDLIIEDNKLVGNETDPDEIEKLRAPIIKDLIKSASFIPRSMSMRQAGKKSNHGLNYDEGYKMFSLQNEIQESEAKIYVELYHKVYPGIRNKYYRSIQSELDKDRTLVNCFGRSFRFMGRMDNDLLKSAYSFKPQSTVVDLLNRGIISIYNNTLDIFKPLELLAQVHDSILEQYPLLPSNQITDIVRMIDKQIEYLDTSMEYNGFEFKIETDIKVGISSWSDLEKIRWSKNKESIEDKIETLSKNLNVSQRSE